MEYFGKTVKWIKVVNYFHKCSILDFYVSKPVYSRIESIMWEYIDQIKACVITYFSNSINIDCN